MKARKNPCNRELYKIMLMKARVNEKARKNESPCNRESP